MSDDDGTQPPRRPAPRYGEYAPETGSEPSGASGSSGLSEADARIVAEAAEYRRAVAERDAPASSAGRGAKKAGKSGAPQTLAEQMAEERRVVRERQLAERRETEKAAEAARRQARRAPTARPDAAPAAGSKPAYLAGQDRRTAGRRFDAAITFGLLAAGFLNIALSIGSYVDLPGTINRMYVILGGDGTYTPTPQTVPIGISIIAATVLVFAISAVISLRRIARGRIAFWVPLVGAVVATLISALLLMVLLTADPAMQQILLNRGV